MELKDIKDLMTCLEESKLSKLTFKKGDFEIHLEKESTCNPNSQSRGVVFEPSFADESSHKGDRGSVVHRKEKEDAVTGSFVTSPMVGTFYTSPGPGYPSFVQVGDSVSPDTVVCIIEAMKVMNEVKAGMSGKIAEIMIDNSFPVEFGSKLFRIV